MTGLLIAYALAAAVLTTTPGLDTALVLRTALTGGHRSAYSAAFGILLGVMLWGVLVAVGAGALLAASPRAFIALQWAGAAYLCWVGIGLLLRPRERFDAGTPATGLREGLAVSFRRGLLTNLLNPKVGVFYLSFLPQFVPANVAAAPFMTLLAGIHAGLGLIWFAVLIGATERLSTQLRRPGVLQTIDRLTGGLFLLFGARLAATAVR